ncbi:MAG: hypothetical protein PVJ57_13140 [Phycisphaerae bacterium]
MCTAAFLLAVVPPTESDTVKLHGKPPFRNVRVTGFRHGRVVFRGVSGQFLHKPLDQIEWLAIDNLEALGAAEQAAVTGKWSQAAAGYRSALAHDDEPWRAALLRARLTAVLDRAGRFDEAVAVWLELLAGDADAAAGQAPRHPGPPGSPENGSARERLTAALEAGGAPEVRQRLRTLLLDLALYDEVADLPAELELVAPPEERTAPGRRSPLLGLPVASRPAVRPEVPTLGGDSLIFAAARAAIQDQNSGRAVRLLERAKPYISDRERDNWRLLLAQARIDAGEPAVAAADLLSLSESTDDPRQAALALYYLGQAHERLGQPDIARRLYRELGEREDLAEDVRALVERARKRLGE